MNNEIINLAGVMGGLSTSCSESTSAILLECAYFQPDSIMGKAVKYDINSEAAHKFERGVDFLSHDRVIRRFIQIVKNHTEIEHHIEVRGRVKNIVVSSSEIYRSGNFQAKKYITPM